MRTARRRPVDGVRLSLWRATVFFRVITLAVALFLIIRWQPIYARPGVALAVGLAMLAVTAVLGTLAIRGRAGRAAVAADLVLTAGLTLATIPAQLPAQRHGGMVTLTTIWAAGPTIEAALLVGVPGGVLAALLQFSASAVVARTVEGRTLYSGVLLLVVGTVAGLVTTYTARAEAELRAATSAQAALAERERLARSIHDGVLQVLALVHRTGSGAGGVLGALATEAAEQEAALRSLISSRPSVPPGAGRGDLAEQLRALGSARVSVSTPAEAVPLAADVACELTDAVRAAVHNVARHAGDAAHAWVLLEHLGDTVQVTVRDDGVGIEPGRLVVAERDGRIGVARSLRGRIADLGGRCTITSAPGEGTQIELVVPV